MTGSDGLPVMLHARPLPTGWKSSTTAGADVEITTNDRLPGMVDVAMKKGGYVSMDAGTAPDADTLHLNHAIVCAKETTGLIHHSDHGLQYVSIVYNERLAEHGITASTGTVDILSQSIVVGVAHRPSGRCDTVLG